MNRYDTEGILNQYLLFHYGSPQDQLPFSFGPKDSLQFPVRCVECLNTAAVPKNATALDLGCSVGRSSFELTRYCDKIVGIDLSQSFISAAKQIQQKGSTPYTLIEEGRKTATRTATLPSDLFPEKVEFRCANAMEVEMEPFDVVLAANILCRIPDPKKFLHRLIALTKLGGQLIITSPYSWLEEFTPQKLWLGNGYESPLAHMQEIFKGSFSLEKTAELPFLIREHQRKYQWGISQASIWKRISSKP